MATLERVVITPLHPYFAARVEGVNLARTLDEPTFQQIFHAFQEFSVLVFPDQRLSDEQQMAFSRRFGPLETTIDSIGQERRLHQNLVDLSNLDPKQEGKLMDWSDRRMVYQSGNQLWHTDSSFKHVPAKCSLLSARELPSSGGETEFADLRAAWGALPEAKQRELRGLVVEHSIFRSRSQIGFADFNDAIFKELPPVPQALVRHHPASSRTSLLISPRMPRISLVSCCR